MAGWSQAELDAIERALASGSRSVEYSGPTGSRRVTYHSLDELLRLRDLIREEVDPTPASGRTIYRRVQHRKDLD